MYRYLVLPVLLVNRQQRAKDWEERADDVEIEHDDSVDGHGPTVAGRLVLAAVTRLAVARRYGWHMDWSWVGSTIVAVTSLIGVVVTLVSSSRQSLRRLEFEEKQLEGIRERESRDIARDGVEHVAEVMLDSVAVCDHDDAQGPDASRPFNFDEDWHGWFEPKERQIRREIGRIREDGTRQLLELCVQCMDSAYGIATHTTQFTTADAVVRHSANLAFEAATAWLRQQDLHELHQPTIIRLSASIGELYAHMELKGAPPIEAPSVGN